MLGVNTVLFGYQRLICIVAAALLLCLSGNGQSASTEEQIGKASSSQPDLVQQLSDSTITHDVFTLHLLHLTEPELAKLTKNWMIVTRESVRRAAETNIALSTASEATAKRLQTDFEAQLNERNQLLRKMTWILDEWSEKGASEEDVAVYRKYATAVLRSEFQATDPATIIKLIQKWLFSKDGGLRILIGIAVIVISLLLLNIAAVVLSGSFRRSLAKRSSVSTLLRDFLSAAAYWILFVLGAAFVLSSMGFDLTPLMAAFGGASFIIGFATQSTLSNLTSGLLLMINRPFDVGDQVDLAGVSGIVESVSTVSTIIRDENDQTTIIPNKKVWDSVIINKGCKVRPSDTTKTS